MGSAVNSDVRTKFRSMLERTRVHLLVREWMGDGCQPPVKKICRVKKVVREKLTCGARKRLRWTKEEERILIEGILEHGTRWSVIAKSDILIKRFPNDLKDKWRNIKRKSAKEKDSEIAEDWLLNNEEDFEQN